MASREALVTVAVPDSILRLVEGDRLLVVMRNGYSQDQLDSFARITRERFPGVEFTFVTGVQQIAVQQSAADDVNASEKETSA
jgi:hypothetical protein